MKTTNLYIFMNKISTKAIIAAALLPAFPFSVCAADVAEVNGTPYESLDAALTAAEAGQTVKLLDNTTMDASVTLDKAITLDLNGKTVTNNSAKTRPFYVTADAFTVTGNGGSIITPEANTSSFGLFDMQTAGATLTISDATLAGPTDNGSLIKCRQANTTVNLTNVNASASGSSAGIVNASTNSFLPLTLNVTGGTYEYNSTYATCGPFTTAINNSVVNFDGVTVKSNRGPIIEICGSTATFKNCDFTNTETSSYYASCIAVSSKSASTQGAASIDGGTYTANYPVFVYNSGGKVTINGGTFNGNAASIKIDNNVQTDFTAEATVTDGTFNGPVAIGSEASLQVEAGQFSDELKPEYLADGASMGVVTDAAGNKVTVVAGDNVAALIGTTAYTSLADALAAAQAGETVTMMHDATMDASVTLDKAITLDLNGKTVINNSAKTRPFYVTADAFTVTGNGGSIITPEANTSSFGLFDMQTAGATLTISDATLAGPTDNGSLIKCRQANTTVNLTNVNASASGSSAGIVNASTNSFLPLTLNVTGGTYEYNSTYATCGPFTTAINNSVVNFDGVTVKSNRGPIIEICGSTATFKNCDFTNTETSSYYASCIAVSSKSASTQGAASIDGGTYTANYPVFVYNSGGKVNINGGTFNGNESVLKADNSTTSFKSEITVTDGTFNGPVSIGSEASLQVEAGRFDTVLDEKYLAPSCKLQQTTDSEGNIVYDVVPSTSGIDSIETAPATDGAVYNMQGIKVADSIDGLPAGLYITGGKKVLVK